MRVNCGLASDPAQQIQFFRIVRVPQGDMTVWCNRVAMSAIILGQPAVAS